MPLFVFRLQAVRRSCPREAMCVQCFQFETKLRDGVLCLGGKLQVKMCLHTFHFGGKNKKNFCNNPVTFRAGVTFDRTVMAKLRLGAEAQHNEAEKKDPLRQSSALQRPAQRPAPDNLTRTLSQSHIVCIGKMTGRSRVTSTMK